MSNPRLPPEILDHIVDLLHDDPEALKECSLVSKSWTPRTRMYLFAEVNFPMDGHTRSWKKTFPDPSTSPARYVKTLAVVCFKTANADDEADAGDWIRTFSRVVHLWLGGSNSPTRDRLVASLIPLHKSSFVPFHGFSPVLRSLRVAFAIVLSPHLFDLVLSFPLLEDLTVVTHGVCTDDDGVWLHKDRDSDQPSPVVQPQISPMFTGSLELSPGGMEYVSRQLLSLPGGIHFRRLNLTWCYENGPSFITALIEKCCHTLEFLDTCSVSHSEPVSTSINLSKATRLRVLAFRPRPRNIEWVTTALRTITLEHRDLRQVSIYAYIDSTLTNVGVNFRQAIGEDIFRQWLDFDHLLAQLWESHSIHPEIVFTTGNGTEGTRDWIGFLLPKITKKRVTE